MRLEAAVGDEVRLGQPGHACQWRRRGGNRCQREDGVEEYVPRGHTADGGEGSGHAYLRAMKYRNYSLLCFRIVGSGLACGPLKWRVSDKPTFRLVCGFHI